MWHFDIDDYEAKLGGSSASVPDFSATDIQRVIRFSQIPCADDALFRVPANSSDPKGRRIMKLVTQLLIDDDLRIVPAPDEMLPYEIGFERNCGPLVFFDVGVVDGLHALKLNQNPTFPFWITSDSANRLLPRFAV